MALFILQLQIIQFYVMGEICNIISSFLKIQ